mmetsp:Transcript_20509/g.72494  ORF Transcript_20509/g.72494 Transcript_20509/m.72494 type:complete len:261 (+) Transcript_20509:4060-4842(+)
MADAVDRMRNRPSARRHGPRCDAACRAPRPTQVRGERQVLCSLQHFEHARRNVSSGRHATRRHLLRPRTHVAQERRALAVPVIVVVARRRPVLAAQHLAHGCESCSAYVRNAVRKRQLDERRRQSDVDRVVLRGVEATHQAAQAQAKKLAQPRVRVEQVRADHDVQVVTQARRLALEVVRHDLRQHERRVLALVEGKDVATHALHAVWAVPTGAQERRVHLIAIRHSRLGARPRLAKGACGCRLNNVARRGRRPRRRHAV